MELKEAVAIKTQEALVSMEQYRDWGDYMPNLVQIKILDAFALIEELLKSSYVIPKDDLTITQVIDDHYNIGSHETQTVKYVLHAGQRRYVKNIDENITTEQFLEYTKKDFVNELERKYKVYK